MSPRRHLAQNLFTDPTIVGMLFGRHQLIKLSPKKTVEGFVGAFFVTMIFAVGVRPHLAPSRESELTFP